MARMLCSRKNFPAARTLGLVERAKLLAAEIQPPAGLAHETQRHDAVGLHPEVRVAVALGHRLTRDLQNVPEALGNDQPERVDLALQQRIGRNRRAVRQAYDAAGNCRRPVEDGADAAHQRNAGIGRRARHLGDGDGARGGIDRNDIGKRAAGVDADPVTRLACGLCHD